MPRSAYVSPLAHSLVLDTVCRSAKFFLHLSGADRIPGLAFWIWNKKRSPRITDCCSQVFQKWAGNVHLVPNCVSIFFFFKKNFTAVVTSVSHLSKDSKEWKGLRSWITLPPLLVVPPDQGWGWVGQSCPCCTCSVDEQRTSVCRAANPSISHKLSLSHLSLN